MAHEVTVTLSDEEYVSLSAQALESGKTVDMLLHEAVVERIKTPEASRQPLSSRSLQEYLHRSGLTENIPSGEADTAEEQAERERLARLFGQGKPASEMVIEDRGPL